MNRVSATDPIRPIRVIAMILIIAALYFARDILIPAALAVLLTFMLYPLVNRFRRWGMNRVLAVVVTVIIAGGVVVGIGYLVTYQLLDLTAKLPDYRDNLRGKVREIRSSGGSTLTRLSGTIEELKQELATTNPATAPAVAATPGGPIIAPPTPQPMKVQLVDEGPDFPSLAASMATPLLVPLAGAAITSLLVIFLLLHSDDLRERLITFAGMRQISLTTTAMDEAGTRIGRFLRMQALVNASYGAMVAIGLFAFGVPNALLWGVIGFLLRFVPYIGPWLAAVMPSLLAIAVFQGWARPIGVLSMFVVVEFVTNMILEPWLYGNSVGISSLGIVCAAVFWAWVWGPVGMILAVPVTACLVVMGKHVPQLALLHQLFGTDVSVPTVGRLYQRLLVGDDASADEIVTTELETSSFEIVCDSLLLPTLAELKRDSAAGVITAVQVRRAIKIVDLVCDVEAPPDSVEPKFVCIAAQNEIDDCVARLLVCAAAREGIAATAVSSHALSSEATEKAAASSAIVVAVVQVPPISTTHGRRLIKALGSKLAQQQRLVDFIGAVPAAPRGLSKPPEADGVQRETSAEALVGKLKELAAVKEPVPPAAPVPPPQPSAV